MNLLAHLKHAALDGLDLAVDAFTLGEYGVEVPRSGLAVTELNCSARARRGAPISAHRGASPGLGRSLVGS